MTTVLLLLSKVGIIQAFTLTTNPVQDEVNASQNVGQFTAGADDGGNFDSNIGIGVVNPTTVFTSPFD